MSSFCFVDLFYIAIPTCEDDTKEDKMQISSVHESDGRFHSWPQHYAIANASHHLLFCFCLEHEVLQALLLSSQQLLSSRPEDPMGFIIDSGSTPHHAL